MNKKFYKEVPLSAFNHYKKNYPKIFIAQWSSGSGSKQIIDLRELVKLSGNSGNVEFTINCQEQFKGLPEAFVEAAKQFLPPIMLEPAILITLLNKIENWFLVAWVLFNEDAPIIILSNSPLGVKNFIYNVFIKNSTNLIDEFSGYFESEWIGGIYPTFFASFFHSIETEKNNLTQLEKLIFDANVALNRKDWNTCILHSVVALENFLRTVCKDYCLEKNIDFSNEYNIVLDNATLGQLQKLILKLPKSDIYIQKMVESLTNLRNQVVHGRYYGTRQDADWAYNMTATIINKMMASDIYSLEVPNDVLEKIGKKMLNNEN